MRNGRRESKRRTAVGDGRLADRRERRRGSGARRPVGEESSPRQPAGEEARHGARRSAREERLAGLSASPSPPFLLHRGQRGSARR